MRGSVAFDDETGGHLVNGPDRRGWTTAIFIAMALTGVVMQMRGTVLPTLQTQFGTPEWQLGLVAPAGTVGYTLVILLTCFGAGSLAIVVAARLIEVRAARR